MHDGYNNSFAMNPFLHLSVVIRDLGITYNSLYRLNFLEYTSMKLLTLIGISTKTLGQLSEPAQ